MRIREDPDGTIWIPKENPALEEALDRLYPRVRGHLRWFKGKDSALKPITSFLGAVTSGPVDDATLRIRQKSCFGDAETPPCPALIVGRNGKYCGGCKCGNWQLARLDGGLLPKLSWATLACPLQRPGFVNSRAGSS